MNLSVEGESVLKAALKSKNISDDIKVLESVTSELEEDLKQHFTAEYPRFIESCANLKNLKEEISEIHLENESFMNLIKDRKAKSLEAKSDLEGYQKAIERICILQEEARSIRTISIELKNINSLLIVIDKKSSDNGENIFKLVKTFKNVNESLCAMQKYSFYPKILKIHEQCLKKAFNYCLEQLKKFVIKITETSNFEFPENFLFSGSSGFENNLMKDVGDVFYIIESLDLGDDITLILNEFRHKLIINKKYDDGDSKSNDNNGVIDIDIGNGGGSGGDIRRINNKISSIIIDKNTRDNTNNNNTNNNNTNNNNNISNIDDDESGSLAFLVSNIVIGHLLSKKFPRTISYNDLIFEKLAAFNIKNFSEIIKIKKLMKICDIKTSKIDFFLEGCIFKVFDKEFQENDVPDNLISFINDSFAFLDEINECKGEFDGILMKLIDDVLVMYVGRSNIDNSFPRQNNAIKVLELLKTRNPDQTFGVEIEISEQNIKIAKLRFDELKKYFLSNGMENIVKKILNIKNEKNKEVKKLIVKEMLDRIDELTVNLSSDEKILFRDTVLRN